MKLKDKNTGKVGEYFLTNQKENKVAVVPNGKSPSEGFIFDTLAELYERFEDPLEEIKPFEEVAVEKYGIEINSAAESDESVNSKHIQIADQDYYEILPDGTKKTEFTWDEAMKIEKKTHGKWRVPSVPEWFAICAAFGRSEDGTDVDPQVLKKNLNLVTDEDGYGGYWSAASNSTTGSYSLGFYASYLLPQDYGNKGLGFAVRCVAAQ